MNFRTITPVNKNTASHGKIQPSIKQEKPEPTWSYRVKSSVFCLKASIVDLKKEIQRRVCSIRTATNAFFKSQLIKLGKLLGIDRFGSYMICNIPSLYNFWDKTLQERLHQTYKDMGIFWTTETVTINGKYFNRVVAAPYGKAKALTLHYIGQGTCAERKGTLQGILDHVAATGEIMVAYNQVNVNGSGRQLSDGKIHKHLSDQTLIADVEAQADYFLKSDLKSFESKLEAGAGLKVNGLCFGGLLAVIAAARLADNPNFRQVNCQKTPLSLKLMISLSHQMERYCPQAGLVADTRTRIKSKLSIKDRLQKLKAQLIVHVHNFTRLLPVGIRSWLVGSIFVTGDWQIDVRPFCQKLADTCPKKVNLLSLNPSPQPNKQLSVSGMCVRWLLWPFQSIFRPFCELSSFLRGALIGHKPCDDEFVTPTADINQFNQTQSQRKQLSSIQLKHIPLQLSTLKSESMSKSTNQASLFKYAGLTPIDFKQMQKFQEPLPEFSSAFNQRILRTEKINPHIRVLLGWYHYHFKHAPSTKRLRSKLSFERYLQQFSLLEIGHHEDPGNNHQAWGQNLFSYRDNQLVPWNEHDISITSSSYCP